jgi:hypothetical protein
MSPSNPHQGRLTQLSYPWSLSWVVLNRRHNKKRVLSIVAGALRRSERTCPVLSLFDHSPFAFDVPGFLVLVANLLTAS